jgi:hypothetical protein
MDYKSERAIQEMDIELIKLAAQCAIRERERRAQRFLSRINRLTNFASLQEGKDAE